MGSVQRIKKAVNHSAYFLFYLKLLNPLCLHIYIYLNLWLDKFLTIIFSTNNLSNFIFPSRISIMQIFSLWNYINSLNKLPLLKWNYFAPFNSYFYLNLKLAYLIFTFLYFFYLTLNPHSFLNLGLKQIFACVKSIILLGMCLLETCNLILKIYYKTKEIEPNQAVNHFKESSCATSNIITFLL